MPVGQCPFLEDPVPRGRSTFFSNFTGFVPSPSPQQIFCLTYESTHGAAWLLAPRVYDSVQVRCRAEEICLSGNSESENLPTHVQTFFLHLLPPAHSSS